jgi:hypothetical protein
MGYKNKTNLEYQREFYAKNKLKRSQYYKDYYRANQEYIRVYQYLYYRNNKREKDIKKVHVIQNNIIISILED